MRLGALVLAGFLVVLASLTEPAVGQLEAVGAVLSVVPVTSILATAGLVGVKLAALSRLLQVLGYDRAYLASGGPGTAAQPIGLQKNYAYMFPYVPGLNISVRGDHDTAYHGTAGTRLGLNAGGNSASVAPGPNGPNAVRKTYPAMSLPGDYENQQRPFRGGDTLRDILRDAGLAVHVPTGAQQAQIQQQLGLQPQQGNNPNDPRERGRPPAPEPQRMTSNAQPPADLAGPVATSAAAAAAAEQQAQPRPSSSSSADEAVARQPPATILQQPNQPSPAMELAIPAAPIQVQPQQQQQQQQQQQPQPVQSQQNQVSSPPQPPGPAPVPVQQQSQQPAPPQQRPLVNPVAGQPAGSPAAPAPSHGGNNWFNTGFLGFGGGQQRPPPSWHTVPQHEYFERQILAQAAPVSVGPLRQAPTDETGFDDLVANLLGPEQASSPNRQPGSQLFYPPANFKPSRNPGGAPTNMAPLQFVTDGPVPFNDDSEPNEFDSVTRKRRHAPPPDTQPAQVAPERAQPGQPKQQQQQHHQQQQVTRPQQANFGMPALNIHQEVRRRRRRALSLADLLPLGSGSDNRDLE